MRDLWPGDDVWLVVPSARMVYDVHKGRVHKRKPHGVLVEYRANGQTYRVFHTDSSTLLFEDFEKARRCAINLTVEDVSATVTESNRRIRLLRSLSEDRMRLDLPPAHEKENDSRTIVAITLVSAGATG